ncbi:Ropporin-1-like protein [Gonapodya sp. JEL0774]|nr:Ropporin-1-like protein [Gonapodya sp. JEL0774]
MAASTMREPIYSADQIKIPSQLPEILKDFAKHIIRTQPADILKESADYFSKQAALHPSPSSKSSITSSRLSQLQLESFYNKFAVPPAAGGSAPTLITRKDVQQACEEIGVAPQVVADIINLGAWGDRIPWLKFWALAVAAGNSSLVPTLHTVAGTLSSTAIPKSDGADRPSEIARLPIAPFKEIFAFLAERDEDIGTEKTAKVMDALGEEKDVELAGFLDKINIILA